MASLLVQNGEVERQKLPQICTVILRIRIGKVAWFAVYICGKFWVTQYVLASYNLSTLKYSSIFQVEKIKSKW